VRERGREKGGRGIVIITKRWNKKRAKKEKKTAKDGKVSNNDKIKLIKMIIAHN
jgi:hypothetical protein